MNCTNCGSPLNEDAKFCKACGAPVAAAPAEAPTTEAAPEVAEAAPVTPEAPAAPVTPEAPFVPQPATVAAPMLDKKTWFKTSRTPTAKGVYIASKIITLIVAIAFIIVGFVTTAAGALLTVEVKSVSEYDKMQWDYDMMRYDPEEDAIGIAEMLEEELDMNLSRSDVEDIEDFLEDIEDYITEWDALESTVVTFALVSLISWIVLTVLMFVGCFSKNWIVSAVGLVIAIVCTFITPLAITPMTYLAFVALIIFNLVIANEYNKYKKSFNQ